MTKVHRFVPAAGLRAGHGCAILKAKYPKEKRQGKAGIKMLEVCFSDSAKGVLAMAQHGGRDVIGGAFAVLTDQKGLRGFWVKQKARREFQKREAELQKIAVPLGGSREDLVGLSLGLSQGDIRAPLRPEGCPRKDCLRQMFALDRYGEGDLLDGATELWDACMADLQKLDPPPAAVRVWLDDLPDSRCGLLFLADLLEEKGTAFHVVELPAKITGADGVTVEYRGWGEVEYQRLGTFLDRERVLPADEVAQLAERWRRLKAENAPLRVVEQGQVVSAGLDYYDEKIRAEFPAASCRVADLIGRALGRQKIPTGDAFIAGRVRHFIESGELVLTEQRPGAGFYEAAVTRRR